MASIQSDKEWLRKNIDDGSIRFYSFDDFIDVLYIGGGGYGAVFKAKVKSIGRTVAYKLLHSQNEDEMLENFIKELKIHRSVDDHPNIVRFLGVSKDTINRYVMVFKYADSGSLRSYLSGSSVELDWPTRCKLGINVANGLRYLHERHIIHKDLSSHNILIHAGVAKITDFGLSDLILQQKTSSNVKGTLPYLDPRCLFDSSTKRDEKSDIFSFGVVLWEISGGKRPCDGLQHCNDIINYRLNGSRDVPVSGTPAEYVALYSECWDDVPEKRPSCEQIFDRLSIMSQPAKILNHAFSDKLSSIWQEELSKGKMSNQIANLIRDWLTDNGWYQQSYPPVKRLKDHVDCGQCSLLLGLFYEHGITIGKDLNQAVYWYKFSTEKNNAFAQYCLGYCYLNGIGVEKDAKKAVELYETAVEQGHADAQYNLGHCYLNGIGVKKDAKKAIELYEKAVEQGNANAQNSLAFCYQHGIGVEKDAKKAVELYEKAVERGNAAAQYNLGHCYQYGIGVEKDAKKAVELYQKAAEQGNANAQSSLAFCYQHGIGVGKDAKKAVKLYEKAVEQGNAAAQYNLGHCYQYGIGVEKDVKKAIKLYEKAVERGNASAQNNLGHCCQYGIGVEKDAKKAVELYEKAVEQGNADAQNNLGYCYRYGIGVEKDVKKAIELYEKAAEQGSVDAQYNLGHCYQFGIGVEKDIKKAVELYQKAAEQGGVVAQNNFGHCYQHGIGVEKDAKKAVELYEKAVEQGNVDAQYNLGHCYQYGIGVEKDVKKAVELYQKAAEQGDVDARDILKTIKM